MAAFVSRNVLKKVLSIEQSEGVGARVRRSIGRPELRNFDPFLMLDEFKGKVGGGFPDHPHRGFETVSYLLPSSEGRMGHEDFCGHKGTLEAGDLQWMTAGRGIVHSEMPLDDKPVHGLQLWVNLSKEHKMCEPRYQELKASDIPHVTKDGVTAIVIAGEALGVKSPVYTLTPVHYIHFTMQPNSTLHQPIPTSFVSFVYVLDGHATFGEQGTHSDAHHTVALTDGADGITVKTTDSPCDFVLIGGQPIREPIFQHGPFVMNTQEDIYKTFDDYQSGKNGFEHAPGWSSEIGRPLIEARRRR